MAPEAEGREMSETTRSLESRLAIAVAHAHLMACIAKENALGRCHEGYIEEVERRLAVVLDEAENAGLLKDVPESELP